MAIQSGALRERINIERHDTASDAWLALTDLPEVWAAVEALGDERFQIQVRYRDDLIGFQDAQPALRVKYRDRVLEVIDIRENSRRETLEITAQAQRIEIPDLGSSARRTNQWPQP
jgi:head-tail adaptor